MNFCQLQPFTGYMQNLKTHTRKMWHLGLTGVLTVYVGAVMAMQTPSDKPTGAFTPDALDDWSERSFAGNTRYELVEDAGIKVLRGHTQGKASILYREQTIDLQTKPIIEWSWKIDNTYKNIDERSRDGDDFPARLYVVAQTGFLPWETVAINYVWASETDIGEDWVNPYTEKAHMVAVQSGDEQSGSWVLQSRNVAEDFKTYFDTDITELSGYAVMVDGDNTGQEATAWFGQISFSAP